MLALKTYIVEDCPVIRDSLIATLEELASLDVVGTAEDELTARTWLTAPDHPVDLVIVDIFLKSGSGLGVLRAAQTLAGPHNTVVLSNFATPEMRRKCRELGADRVFDKSNELEELISYCVHLTDAEPGRATVQ